MIFHELRAIHFHPGKTAGTSIEKMLLPGKRDAMVANRHVMFGYDQEYSIYLQHASCKTMLEIIGEKTFFEYYKFCIIRNPYTRLLSVYYYNFEQNEKRFGSFRQFITALPSLASDTGNLKGAHVIPQIHYTHIDGASVCQSIGRFENLDADLDQIKHDLDIDVETPRENTHRHKRFPADGGHGYYDKEMISVMQDVYQEDFETYGYDPEPPARMRAGIFRPGRLIAAARRYFLSRA